MTGGGLSWLTEASQPTKGRTSPGSPGDRPTPCSSAVYEAPVRGSRHWRISGGLVTFLSPTHYLSPCQSFLFYFLFFIFLFSNNDSLFSMMDLFSLMYIHSSSAAWLDYYISLLPPSHPPPLFSFTTIGILPFLPSHLVLFSFRRIVDLFSSVVHKSCAVHPSFLLCIVPIVLDQHNKQTHCSLSVNTRTHNLAVQPHSPFHLFLYRRAGLIQFRG